MKDKKVVYTRTPSVTDFDILNLELQRIEDSFNTLGSHVAAEVTTTPPLKERELEVRVADGVGWNPGKGAGLYIYLNGKWNKIAFA